MSESHRPRPTIGEIIDSLPLPTFAAPDTPVARRATPEQEAEINAAVKAGRIVFEPGWNDPRSAQAPTEQAEPIARLRDAFVTYMSCPTVRNYDALLDTIPDVIDRAAALAARQAPAELRRLSVGQIGAIAGECEIALSPELLLFASKVRAHTGGLRGQAPDSRDAAQIADLILGNEGMRVTSPLESSTGFGDDIEHRFEIGDGISRTGVVITLTKLRALKSTAAIAQEQAQ